MDSRSQQRSIYLFGEVNDASAREVVLALDAGVKRLVINSPGGSIDDALAIYDALRAAGNVETVATGSVQSAAVIAYLGGERRSAARHTRFMMHPVSVEKGLSEVVARERQRLTEVMVGLIAERTGIPARAMRELLKCEIYFDASKALALGFAHEIVGGTRPGPEAINRALVDLNTCASQIEAQLRVLN